MGEVDLIVRLRALANIQSTCSPDTCSQAADEIERLRAAGFDVIERIEAWEAAVRTIIGRDAEHGMDLTRLRAALHTNDGEGAKG